MTQALSLCSVGTENPVPGDKCKQETVSIGQQNSESEKSRSQGRGWGQEGFFTFVVFEGEPNYSRVSHRCRMFTGPEGKAWVGLRAKGRWLRKQGEDEVELR